MEELEGVNFPQTFCFPSLDHTHKPLEMKRNSSSPPHLTQKAATFTLIQRSQDVKEASIFFNFRGKEQKRSCLWTGWRKNSQSKTHVKIHLCHVHVFFLPLTLLLPCWFLFLLAWAEGGNGTMPGSLMLSILESFLLLQSKGRSNSHYIEE